MAAPEDSGTDAEGCRTPESTESRIHLWRAPVAKIVTPSPSHQVSQNPRNPNKTAKRIGKIQETQGISKRNRQNPRNPRNQQNKLAKSRNLTNWQNKSARGGGGGGGMSPSIQGSVREQSHECIVARLCCLLATYPFVYVYCIGATMLQAIRRGAYN